MAFLPFGGEMEDINMIQKHFEVKTGKNKGFYIVINADDQKSYNILAKTYGILNIDYNFDFYKYHGVNNLQLIWTHSHFAGHEFNRKVYADLLRQLGCSDWKEFKSKIL